jgi:TRAP-type C4-dicarboxylate transport system permease small subunit
MPDVSPLTHKFLAPLAHVATLTAGAALVGMAGVEAWQVFARYVLNRSPGWTEPVALLLLSTAMSLGAASGVRGASHFGFFILVQSSPPALRRLLQMFSNLVIAVISALLMLWSIELFADGISVPMAGVVLPQGVWFLPMAVGAGLMTVFALERAFVPIAVVVQSEP